MHATDARQKASSQCTECTLYNVYIRQASSEMVQCKWTERQLCNTTCVGKHKDRCAAMIMVAQHGFVMESIKWTTKWEMVSGHLWPCEYTQIQCIVFHLRVQGTSTATSEVLWKIKLENRNLVRQMPSEREHNTTSSYIMNWPAFNYFLLSLIPAEYW